ncbi:hypothetical protein Hanom_Chr01g00071321 [Helianthus anomalus]
MNGVNDLDENGNTLTQMQKNKPLDESRKSGQTSGTKMAFYSWYKNIVFFIIFAACNTYTIYQ